MKGLSPDMTGEFDMTKTDTHTRSDWADEKAREWLSKSLDRWTPLEDLVSLAALLREVAQHSWSEVGKAAQLQGQAQGRGSALAEVRRVVEEVQTEFTVPTAGCADATAACDEILARLEKL